MPYPIRATVGHPRLTHRAHSHPRFDGTQDVCFDIDEPASLMPAETQWRGSSALSFTSSPAFTIDLVCGDCVCRQDFACPGEAELDGYVRVALAIGLDAIPRWLGQATS